MENQAKIFSFDPIVDHASTVLILGSAPSVLSLEKSMYYGNPRNYFWPMVYSLFSCELQEDYALRKAFLLSHHIALWDSCKSCVRPGSMDQNIQQPVPNDIPGLLRRYPRIRFILFNGNASEKIYRKIIGPIEGITYYSLPSTSPIPRKHIRSLEDILFHWQILKKLCDSSLPK